MKNKGAICLGILAILILIILFTAPRTVTPGQAILILLMLGILGFLFIIILIVLIIKWIAK